MYFPSQHTDENGTLWQSIETVTVPDGHGNPTKVQKLSDDEAKLKINKEYGFEIGSIKILADCWYEATDWNYFKFSVQGRWGYEVRDYGQLNVLDWKGGDCWE